MQVQPGGHTPFRILNSALKLSVMKTKCEIVREKECPESPYFPGISTPAPCKPREECVTTEQRVCREEYKTVCEPFRLGERRRRRHFRVW